MKQARPIPAAPPDPAVLALARALARQLAREDYARAKEADKQQAAE
jgi:hypothetical protein